MEKRQNAKTQTVPLHPDSAALSRGLGCLSQSDSVETKRGIKEQWWGNVRKILRRGVSVCTQGPASLHARTCVEDVICVVSVAASQPCALD